MTVPFANRSREAVFLCYHSIADEGAPYLALPPATFERQLALLRRVGYRSGRIADLRQLARGERLDGPTAFLTFDDGYRDNHAVAMPLLGEYGFSPIVFLLPRHVDGSHGFAWPEIASTQEAHPGLLRSLSWREVDEMAAAGAEFGSHTLTHPHLPSLDDEALAHELAESRVLLQERLGKCDTLAYPFGESDARVAQAARRAGYEFAFTLPQGPQPLADHLSIARVNVDRRDGPVRFRAKLSPAGRRLLLSSAGERVRSLRPRGRGG